MSEDQLRPIEDKINTLTAIVQSHIGETKIYRESQAKLLSHHDKDLNGNGTPGIKTRIDRLERTEQLKNWVLGSIFLAVLGIIGSYFLDK